MATPILPQTLRDEIMNCVKEALASKPVDPEPLWDTRKVAEYLGLSTSYLTNKVVKTPGFPPPCIKEGRKYRWLARDIRRYTGEIDG